MRALSGVATPTRLLPPLRSSTENKRAEMEGRMLKRGESALALASVRGWSHTIGLRAT
jgi:hypothetical protein